MNKSINIDSFIKIYDDIKQTYDKFKYYNIISLYIFIINRKNN